MALMAQPAPAASVVLRLADGVTVRICAPGAVEVDAALLQRAVQLVAATRRRRRRRRGPCVAGGCNSDKNDSSTDNCCSNKTTGPTDDSCSTTPTTGPPNHEARTLQAKHEYDTASSEALQVVPTTVPASALQATQKNYVVKESKVASTPIAAPQATKDLQAVPRTVGAASAVAPAAAEFARVVAMDDAALHRCSREEFEAMKKAIDVFQQQLLESAADGNVVEVQSAIACLVQRGVPIGAGNNVARGRPAPGTNGQRGHKWVGE